MPPLATSMCGRASPSSCPRSKRRPFQRRTLLIGHQRGAQPAQGYALRFMSNVGEQTSLLDLCCTTPRLGWPLLLPWSLRGCQAATSPFNLRGCNYTLALLLLILPKPSFLFHLRMKNTLFLALAIATTSLPATAQTEKGAKYLGIGVGNLNYRKGDQYSASQLSAAFHPAAGVFVADNILVGGNLTLGYDRLSFDIVNYRRRTIQYGVTPFGRVYLPSTSAHRFFGQLSAGITWADTRIKNRFNYVESNLFDGNSRYRTAGLALGYNYFLAPNAALELTTGYNRIGGSSSYGELDVRVGFSVFLPSK
jgi:hypothetical protein